MIALAYDNVVTQDGLKYGLDDCTGIATVIGHDGECTGKVRIPTIVEHNGNPYVVTVIGSCAFYNCGGLTSIKLPKTLREIGNSAFRECTGLSSIVIPRSLQTIGNDAFNGCTHLHSVWFISKRNIQQIGERAFYDCLSLPSMNLPASIPHIGQDAFGYSEYADFF